MDVTESHARFAAVVKTIGSIDVLFNCAGVVHDGDILACRESDWDHSFDVNVKSCYRTIQAVLPGMVSQGGGSIINVSSVASNLEGRAGTVRIRGNEGGRGRTYASGCRRLCQERESVAMQLVPGPLIHRRCSNASALLPIPAEARRVFEKRQAMGSDWVPPTRWLRLPCIWPRTNQVIRRVAPT